MMRVHRSKPPDSIGDKFITIDPGGSGKILKPGGKISDTTGPIDIEDLISKFAFGDIKSDDKKDTK